MKKNKFLSGLSAKLALAIVALTTTIFSFSQEVHATPKNINAPALNNLNIIFIALSFNY